MMDKVLGSDETLRAKGHHKGGELVELDGEEDTSAAGDTAPAKNASKIGQTAYGSEDGSSEEYENDFHEMLEEVMRH